MPGVISQGTTITFSQSLPQFQTGQPREINSSGVLVKDENIQQQQHNNNASQEGNDVTLQSQDRPHNPDSECESQYLKLQKMSNQQATVAEQASNPPNGSKQKEEISVVSFVWLVRSVVGDQVLRLAILTVQQQHGTRLQECHLPIQGPHSFLILGHLHKFIKRAQALPRMSRTFPLQLARFKPCQASRIPMECKQVKGLLLTNQEGVSMQGLDKQQQQQRLHFSQT
ncbi:hypothetical protein TIFTF001_046592 [Ficus carica]|uniref:Uncharacterized protein n=1 Tax=Ficus carica TaxID=3494 RepID=A0AA87ZCH1_FICCA|nr:hypothetical protein TIFTF001_046592 [Ficus carica]